MAKELGGITAALGSHDGDNSVRESALVGPHGLHEMIQPRDVELALSIDQLRRAALVIHGRSTIM